MVSRVPKYGVFRLDRLHREHWDTYGRREDQHFEIGIAGSIGFGVSGLGQVSFVCHVSAAVDLQHGALA